MPALPRSSEAFIRLVQERLHRHAPPTFAFDANGDLRTVSAVLFLLGAGPDGEPMLILNKRSQRVRQSGDLCCPGGGISPIIDRLLAIGLQLPATPLSRWPHRSWWGRCRKNDFPKLALVLAAALREGLEEMRLNPFGVRFLGPMPVQHLVMFKRSIYPLAGWVNCQRQFFPNWEVEKILRIPVVAFFDADNYARYRISFKADAVGRKAITYRDMPCFVYRHKGQNELLWGATFRIVEHFLKTMFDYVPPMMNTLPLIHRRLDQRYLEGTAAP